MKTQLLQDDNGRRTFMVVLDIGDEVMACLRDVAAAERLEAAQITAIGAFREAKLAFFDWASKSYRDIPVDEQVEVASLVGDIATDEDGKPVIHVHAVLGRMDGSAVAGHLVRGIVRPTLEVVITESPAHLTRRFDRTTGLTLIQPRS